MILKIIKINLIKVFIPFLFLGFLSIVIYPKLAFSAPGDYCASGTCLPQDVWDLPYGCNYIYNPDGSINYCTQKYERITKNCDPYCTWTGGYVGEYCNNSCETTPTEVTRGSCCLGTTGGDPIPCEMWCAPFYPPDESAKGCGTGGIECPEGQECRMPGNCGGSSCSCATWRPWSECTKPCNDGTPGTQTRTRDCSPDACKVESETQDCNTQLCTGSIDGIVWANNPINNDVNFQDGEEFTGSSILFCSSQTTNLSFTFGEPVRCWIVGGRRVCTIPPKTLQNLWFCDRSISKYITSSTIPMSTNLDSQRIINIVGVGTAPMDAYRCNGVSWAFTNRTTGATRSGIGCTARLSEVAAGNNNELHWNLKEKL